MWQSVSSRTSSLRLSDGPLSGPTAFSLEFIHLRILGLFRPVITVSAGAVNSHVTNIHSRPCSRPLENVPKGRITGSYDHSDSCLSPSEDTVPGKCHLQHGSTAVFPCSDPGKIKAQQTPREEHLTVPCSEICFPHREVANPLKRVSANNT